MHSSFIYRVLFFLLIVSLAVSAFGQTGVAPVAGSGAAGFTGDGGQALGATLNGPTDAAVDPQGNLFIADRNNNRVRKVSTGGVITTAAGNGNAGSWYLEGGPAVSSVLNHPFAAAADAGGNLYIGDFGGFSTTSFTNLYIADEQNTTNSRIHRVNAGDGTIHEVPVPIALSGVLSIAVDAAGNLYVAERLGQRIFRVAPATGAITPIAGTGTAGFSGDGGAATAARLNNPAHLGLDAAGNLYFADSGNNRIRKVAAGTNIITTVGGTGGAGFSGDDGPAVNAQLNDPEGLSVDAAGDVFIADRGNDRVRRISGGTGLMTTVITTQATTECGSFTASLQAPASVLTNAAGDTLFIADDSGNRVWKADLHPKPIPPTLTAITPPTGAPGTQVTVTLTGTGFAGNGTPGCQTGAAAVSAGGSGITVSGITVSSDTSLTANFAIAASGSLGAHAITVGTDGGASNAATFMVSIPVAPPPSLTSIAPSSGVRGTSLTVTFTGTNFDTIAGGTNVTADDGGISIGQVTVASATSLTAVVTIGASETLGIHNLKVATTSGSSGPQAFTVTPGGLSFVYNLPQVLDPAEQTPVQVALATATPDTVTGTLTLTFTPNATNSADDPNVTFVNADTSARSSDVSFPANTTTAHLAMSNGVLQAGTVAGTIELSMANVQDGGVNVASTNGTFDIQVPRLPPVITSIAVLNLSAAGFELQLTGYSTPRDITGATFTFGAASGQKLLTVELKPDVTSPFTTYYQSPASDPTGSAFVYTQPFSITQGTIKAVASVTVTLSNSAGASMPASASLQ
ncbi:MAG TPA: IPT/TIG domain-containing protein [Terriglobia bacterium]|jgi:sugar lactone lactonase YvrE